MTRPSAHKKPKQHRAGSSLASNADRQWYDRHVRWLKKPAVLLGPTADQVQASRGWYSPMWHYENEPVTRETLVLIFDDHFSLDEPGIFASLHETLLDRGDYHMHLADIATYARA